MKKTISKIGILISFLNLFNIQSSYKIDCISVTQVGESDKPFKTLFITVDKNRVSKFSGEEILILTDDKTFNETIAFIRQNDTDEIENLKRKIHEYGCFEIVFFERNYLVKNYKIRPRIFSIRYFKKLIDMLSIKRLDKKFITELKLLENRINY